MRGRDKRLARFHRRARAGARSWVLVWLSLAAAGPGVLAQERGVRVEAIRAPAELEHTPVDPRTSVMSTCRRFRAVGLSKVENLALVQDLAAVAGQVEDQVGAPLPFAKGQCLVVQARSDLSNPRPRVVRAQGWVDGGLEQKLVLLNAEVLAREDVLECFCWLLLNRYAAALVPAAQRTGVGPGVPDWVSVGLAHTLFPALRDRDRQLIKQELELNRWPACERILEMEYLPEGVWTEKAFAAWLVDWLLADPRWGGRRWQDLFERVAAGQGVDAAWVAQHWVGAGGDMQAQWVAHLQRQARIRAAWGNMALEDFEELHAALLFHPRAWNVETPAEVPDELTCADLIQWRAQPWMPRVARIAALQVKSLQLGRHASFGEVVAAYGVFFDQLVASAGRSSFWGWRRRAQEEQLQAALAAAEKKSGDLQALLAKRAQYLDQYARPTATNADTKATQKQPRSRLQQYVDEQERLHGGAEAGPTVESQSP